MQTHDMSNLDHIAPAIRHMAIAMDSIVPDPANARKHSPRNIETVAGSLRSFGQQTPIVVDARGVIRKGSGTYVAARSLGWTMIAATTTNLTGSQLAAYGIADNRSGDPDVGSEWDADALAIQLEALRDDDALVGVGFTPDEVAKLITDANPTFSPATADDQGRLDETNPITCPNCGHVFSP